MAMTYKFEQLNVWQNATEYLDLIYDLASKLPKGEDFNLKSQMIRAATSICLNIAEGSTGQSDAEQSRFLSMALRSLIETVACQLIIRHRKYLSDDKLLNQAYDRSNDLARKIQAFRNSLREKAHFIKEDSASYFLDEI